MKPFHLVFMIAICAGLASGACNPFGGSDPGGGPTVAAGSLTGDVASARLAAKGWQWMVQPNIVAAGNARTTTFMTSPPNTMTIMVMEYNPLFAQAAYDAMKGNDPSACRLFGSTIVQMTGGTPELRTKAMADLSTP
jgi:hypothetical protein